MTIEASPQTDEAHHSAPIILPSSDWQNDGGRMMFVLFSVARNLGRSRRHCPRTDTRAVRTMVDVRMPIEPFLDLLSRQAQLHLLLLVSGKTRHQIGHQSQGSCHDDPQFGLRRHGTADAHPEQHAREQQDRVRADDRSCCSFRFGLRPRQIHDVAFDPGMTWFGESLGHANQKLGHEPKTSG